MKKYLTAILSENGACAHIVANSDNLKPYIIYYCGSQSGGNYATIWGAARRLEKLRDAWRGNGAAVMEVYEEPALITVVGCQPDWIRNYFKRGYYSVI